MKSPRIYLLHIHDALENIRQFTVGGEEEFLLDKKTQAAVIYKLAIIGEAVKKLPKALRDEYPAVPWKSIAGLRDIVIHEYDSTEIPIIWKIIEKDVPTLRDAIEEMLIKFSE
jgi:uncharacterized protein with HEPN domain